MNILFIHEIDWVKKVIYEPHHFSELLSIRGHNVFAIDCPEPQSDIVQGLSTQVLENYHRVYENASITLIRPPSLLIKGLNRLTSFFSCKKTIEKTIKENQIELIYLYGIATNGIQTVSIAKKYGIPVVFRELDISHKFVKIPILQTFTKFLEKSVLSNCNKVYSCTPELQRYSYSMGVKKSNSEFFPLGIRTKIFKKSERDEKLSESLKLKTTDFVLVFVGTLYSFSGLLNIIEQFPKMILKVPHLKLIIVGGGPDYVKIKNLIMKLNLSEFVHVTDFIDQKFIPSYISLANLCLNSFEKNKITNQIIPIKVLEYLACGKPVLSTPLDGTLELMPPNDYGVVYSNLENFPERIIEFSKNIANLSHLGTLGYDFVHENHDWENLTTKLIEKFQNLKDESC